ncbi:F-box domain - like 10 [Theobroma cacao]|nr:F-box domain - like 10 [Theobroma cacao]
MSPKMEAEEIIKTEEKKPYCLCRLPEDVLTIILRYLSVLDYIQFRAVSKCWRLAFSSCASSTTSQQHPERELPWFVVLKTEPVLGMFHWVCMPGSTCQNYAETRILLSKYGYLALCLTYLLHLHHQIAWFSSHIVSSAYMLGLICAEKENLIGLAMEVGVKGPIINAVFAKGILYYLHSSGQLNAFDAVHHNYIHIAHIQGLGSDFYTFSRLVSYTFKLGELVLLRIHACFGCYEIALSSPHALTAYEDSEYLFPTDVKEAIEREREVTSVDSFNPDAWCLVYRSGGTFECRWHQFTSDRTVYYDLEELSCHVRNECSTFLMWFDPLGVEPSDPLLT